MTGADLSPLGPERLVAVDGVPDAAALAGFACLRLGAQEYLVLDATADQLPALPAALAIDVGDAWEGWSLTGPGAAALLARACPLDLSTFVQGAATRTAMAGIAVLLRRTGSERWELRVERSYAAWFEAWLRQV
jgi:heterotetrameric sarcosine oxidase gamma subunit